MNIRGLVFKEETKLNSFQAEVSCQTGELSDELTDRKLATNLNYAKSLFKNEVAP